MSNRLNLVKSAIFFGVGIIISTSVLPGSSLRVRQTQQQVGAAGQQVQAAEQAISFEVASIKPSEGDGHMVRIQTSPGGRYTASGVTLKMLIQQAYDIKEFQISGGPAWMSSLAFDIVAKAENPDVKREQLKLMLQSLLAERFQLKFHRETKELPVYALVVGKNGHKLHLSEIQPSPDGAPVKPLGSGDPAAPGGAGAKPAGAMMRMGRGQLDAQMTPVAALVNMLAQQLGRPVIDKTALKGSFDFKLEWTPDESPHRLAGGGGSDAPPPADSSGPSIFTAIQEQLGLRLESQRGPVETLVIDSAEKPSVN